MKPTLSLEGAALVLWDTYTAATAIRVGDAVKISDNLTATGTQATSDDAVGLAYRSAQPGQSVPVVVAGVFRTTAASPVSRGDILVPAPEDQQGNRGRARSLTGLNPVLSASARRHAVALQDQPVGGRAVRVQLLR